MTLPADYLEKYLKDVEGRIAQIRESLEPLESGQIRLAEQPHGSSAWNDTTQAMVEHHKRNIDLYQRIAAALRKQLGH